ncbi:MAG: sulfotransferase [Rhizomicrobium sp.]
MIIIGLGTGRSGTASLAKLLNAQRDAHCFHEMNPSCVRFSGTLRPILNAIDEFQSILDGGDPSMITVDLSRAVAARAYDDLRGRSGLRLIGDIAFYYLSYVPAIAAYNPNVRFLCMRRDIDRTIQSWMDKTRVVRWPSRYIADRLSCLITRQPFYESGNYWMVHDGSTWEPDPVWDKCFPKFEANSKMEAIRKYCEFYYKEAEILAAAFPATFRLVETDRLSEPTYQTGILEFLEIAREDHIRTSAHINQTRLR